jgi:hypothetical protein
MNKFIAVDTNVLLDILTNDPNFKDKSIKKLYKNSQTHQLVINESIFCELLVHFSNKNDLNRFLEQTNIQFIQTKSNSFAAVASAWKKYLSQTPKKVICPKCGKKITLQCPKCEHIFSAHQHILTDFLIGGFALTETNGLITRDYGYYKTYFPSLKIL